jgi:predicted metal-dependent enzyme (double-stranded beta helix superfamily)
MARTNPLAANNKARSTKQRKKKTSGSDKNAGCAGINKNLIQRCDETNLFNEIFLPVFQAVHRSGRYLHAFDGKSTSEYHKILLKYQPFAFLNLQITFSFGFAFWCMRCITVTVIMKGSDKSTFFMQCNKIKEATKKRKK